MNKWEQGIMMRIVLLIVIISFALPVFAQGTIDNGKYTPTKEEIEANERIAEGCEIPLLSDFD